MFACNNRPQLYPFLITRLVVFAWLDGSDWRGYNARYDADIRDDYSNYQPGALAIGTPGQGV